MPKSKNFRLQFSVVIFYCLLSLSVLKAQKKTDNSPSKSDQSTTLIQLEGDQFQTLLKKTVKDRTLKLSVAEVTLQYQILQQLQKSRESGDVGEVIEFEKSGLFQMLLKFRDNNRGKLFRADGEIRKVTKIPVEQNDFGISTLYQIQFYPFNSEGFPVFLNVTSLPEGVTVGNDLHLEASAVGLFLKIQALPEGSKPAVAPLLLTESVELINEDDFSFGLSPNQFSGINHKSIGIGASEYELYYHLLRLAEDVPEKEQQAAAKQFQKECKAKRPRYQKNPRLAFATYYDLFKHFEEYEGKLVTLKGVARKHIKYPADENEFGIETIHELWIFNEKAHTNPAVFVCTNIEGDLPLGEDMNEMVEMTGFFFKMYGYKAQDTLRRVPMLLGGTTNWFPDEAPPPETNNWWWMIGIPVLFCLLLFALWRMRRKDNIYQEKRTNTDLPDEPDFSNMKDENA